MSDEQCRKEFEAWYRRKCDDESIMLRESDFRLVDSAQYFGSWMEDMFQAWQAARQSRPTPSEVEGEVIERCVAEAEKYAVSAHKGADDHNYMGDPRTSKLFRERGYALESLAQTIRDLPRKHNDRA